jgi:outer membrane protein assembly factor BamE (lipoprotein component of BamABCDE complex)
MTRSVNIKILRSITALFLLGVFVACVSYTAGKVTAGFDIKEEVVSQIVKGTTTQDEIIDWFGVPSAERTVEGKDQYFYEYREAAGVGVGVSRKRKTLLVKFDGSKMVEDYAYKLA